MIILEGRNQMPKRKEPQLMESGASDRPINCVVPVEPGPGHKMFHHLGQMLERVKKVGPRNIFLDMSGVRVITSTEWGLLFAEVENEAVGRIVLFNAGEAVRRSAVSMGVGRREGPYAKLSVHPDDAPVINDLTPNRGDQPTAGRKEVVND
jgi:hypothetical protein